MRTSKKKPDRSDMTKYTRDDKPDRSDMTKYTRDDSAELHSVPAKYCSKKSKCPLFITTTFSRSLGYDKFISESIARNFIPDRSDMTKHSRYR
jgi:hypothetical protein